MIDEIKYEENKVTRAIFQKCEVQSQPPRSERKSVLCIWLACLYKHQKNENEEYNVIWIDT